MQIAYFINQYPKVSQSFIRREILALERQGFQVLRVALRGWDASLVDNEDRQEQGKTRYVLREPFRLIFSALVVFLRSPVRFFSALWLAIRMSKHADRPLPYHLAYFLEACQTLIWLEAFGASHVHAHFGTNSTEVVMLARELGGPPYSFTVHGPTEFDKPAFLGIGEKVRRSAFVVAISSFGRGQLCRWVEYEHWSKIFVVHCGLDEAFHNVPRVPIPSNPRLVCVGRLCEAKGQMLLVEATYRLYQRGIALEVVLAGDGELRAQVESLVGRYGLTGKVRITGWLSSEQVREEILAARALVLPSFAEGLPVVIMEAMALRRPVLTTYVAGIPELVLPAENGWLFPSGSIDALVSAIERFLEKPTDELVRMGEAGRLRVLERHSIDREVRKLASLFNESE